MALLVIMFVVATTGVVSAQNSQSVTVTANPRIYVTGLTATYISDYEIDLSWAMAANVTNVMVRAKWGSTPINRNDGILVYYGNGTSMTHFLESSLAFATEPLYYVIWSQKDDGTWLDGMQSAGGDFMSSTVLFIVVAILTLGLSLAYTWKRQGFFAYAASVFWLFLGIIAYQTSASPSPLEMTDIYMGLFWVCVGMVITFALLPAMTREKVVKEEGDEQWEGEDLSAFGEGYESKVKVLTPEQQARRRIAREARTGIVRAR